ncbi:hypothetical protein D3C85_877080 [compost metagenome]
MFALSAGVVKLVPVAIGLPPVATVYQLIVLPAVGAVAESVAVCPLEIFTLVEETCASAGSGLTITSTC